MRRTLIAMILAAMILAPASGCASNKPAVYEPATVTREMRQMVTLRYQPAVKSELPSPASAVFTQEPQLTAQRNQSTGRMEVTAEGEVDAQNQEGVTTMFRYNLTWEEGLGGWKLRKKSVLAEGE